MSHTRELHIISGELNILKRTLSPLHNMINTLRDHRPTRRTMNSNSMLVINPAMGIGAMEQFRPQIPDQVQQERVHGANISILAKTYLADVVDHVLILTEEIDMLRATVENMINMVSHARIYFDIDFQSRCSYAK